MDLMRSLLILFIITPALGYALTGKLMQSNGCGSTFSIDWALDDVGEEEIVPCCNAHDDCYDTCGKTQSECDDAFQSCLNTACSQLNGNGFNWWITFRRAACKQDGNLLFDIVDAFGSSAYNDAQSNCSQ